MCDSWSGEPIEITSNTPKDVQGLRKQLIALLNAKMGQGATGFGGQLTPGMNDLQKQGANMQSFYAQGRGFRGNTRGMGGYRGPGTGSTTVTRSIGSMPGHQGPGNPPPAPPREPPPAPPQDPTWPQYPRDPGNPWQGQPGAGPCFTEGTLVLMFDGSDKDIIDVAVGDEVMSFDVEKGLPVPAKVTEIFAHEPSEAPRLMCVNDDILVTPEHSFYINKEWKQVKEARIYDKLTGPNGEDVAVTMLSVYPGGVRTYNFHTDNEAHNYFAGGVLVHNAIPKQPTGGPTGYGNSPMADLFNYWSNLG